jgi:DNA helicase II / ATP-dependent DNA helicase PcrA
MNNRLIIAAAGSGKTTLLISEAMRLQNEKVLITTYTQENEEEIKKKLIKKYKCIPTHITIQTWFSFLIQHGVRPYQGTLNNLLFNKEVKGMILNNGEYGFKYFSQKFKNWIPYKEDEEFLKHYFTESGKILSDRLPKFVVKSNYSTGGELIKRISRIFQNIFIDEVQDLAGYDLDILKLLFQTTSNILLVGDPRQVTYLTHHENKYGKYKDGKIREFIIEECNKSIHYTIDETTLNCSHRNNNEICEFSSLLYEKEFSPIEPCKCHECRNYEENDEGIYFVKSTDIDDYLFQYNPIQLRWNINRKVNSNYSVLNFGESKGRTFKRVLIYPTEDMRKWLLNHKTNLAFSTKAKLYVGITRARFSVGFVLDLPNEKDVIGIKYYKPNNQGIAK